MADPHVISALQDKAYQLRQAIVSYEELLERDRKELAVITAALTIFKRDGALPSEGRPAEIRNLFKRGEVAALARAALADAPAAVSTRELAVACLRARGFDHDDPVLCRAMVGLLSNTLRKQMRRRELVRVVAKRKDNDLEEGLEESMPEATLHPRFSQEASLMTVDGQ